jgi:hypothetical protein
MKRITVKQASLAFILASALPLAACGKSSTPTSPTQSGPPVADTPAPVPTPTPEPPVTPPPAPPTDNRPIETLTGTVVNLTRGGANSLDITFRIDDFTIVRASGDTPVTSGSQTGRTDFVRNGQTVTVEGRRSNGFLDATKISIIAQAP